MSVEELLQHAESIGVRYMALTDINNTSGCLDFMRLAPKYKIKPSIGIDFRRSTEQLYIGIANNLEGFKELNEFLSIYTMKHEHVPLQPPSLPNCTVIYPWKKQVKYTLKSNEWIGLRPSDIVSFRLYGKNVDRKKLVILPTASFRNKKDFNTHRLLRAIFHNELLSKLPKTEQGKEEDKFLHLAEIMKCYEEYQEAIQNTQHILKHNTIDFEFGKSKNKKCFTGDESEDKKMLRQLTSEGLHYRYPNPTAQILERLETELTTIEQLDFTAYFLINWDIVRFASSQGFFHIGRGSGANSLVAYCLRITDVDPIELDLYFERFINPSRRNPPDFDIDFSHTDRDIVREYIFEKYKGHVALVGSYSTFQRKSCIREIGKVFGLPDEEIGNLQSDRVNPKTLDKTNRQVLEYASYIHELPNQLSVHACGILISEKPITYYTPLELFPVGFPSAQFSMLEAEDVGLYKYDILSQRGLGHIKDAVSFIKQNRGEEVDIHRIQDFKRDDRIRQMLKSGNTVACFYVESPAMRQLLRKLQVEDYLGLVAASSVIRPGVSSSGMMREYILRYRYPEKRKDAHPILLEIMPETYGVMVYQEDVIRVAHIYAGLTLEEADVMRRGMSGKFRSRTEFQHVKEKFFSNCKQKGYEDTDAAEVWRQIESFAGYSFAKGHSASYAVESYQSLYLRAYYPIEFMTGVLNNFGGYYTTEFYLHEARMLGAQIELPCVNKSDNLATLFGKTIYMGFYLVKDLEQGTIKNLLSTRTEGEFKSLDEFVKRVAISLEQLRILIRIKAFRFTGKTCKELLWDAHLLLGKVKKTIPKRELFETEQTSTELPPLEYDQYEEALDEMKILSFPFTSPFALLKKQYGGMVYADELLNHLGNVVYMVGYYHNIRGVTTVDGNYMSFGCFTDRKGNLFDTVHFPDSIEKYPFTGKGCYLLKGTVLEDFGVPSLDVSHMQRIPWVFNKI